MRDESGALVAHAFRRSHARVLAALVRRLGSARLDLAEDALQDALVSALEHWRYSGVPKDVDAWLYRAAWRKALDQLARRKTAARESGHVAAMQGAHDVRTSNEAQDNFSDDELAMLFLCAHPTLGLSLQVTLMLRVVCGLSVPEIAAALLVSEATVSQRLVRAKRTLAAIAPSQEWHDITDAVSRVPAVQQAIYLMFTEGYAASSGAALVRRELCNEAVRLAEALAASDAGARGDSYALCALLHFQRSRLAARERDGLAVPLEQQDRTRWDRLAIARGFHWLARAMESDTLTRLHLQAGIASQHALAPRVEETDWQAIDRYYEQLRAMGDSDVLRVNHAVARSYTSGANAALDMIADMDAGGYHLVSAVRARLLERAGNVARSRAEAARAVKLARTAPERRLMEARLASLAPEGTGQHVEDGV